MKITIYTINNCNFCKQEKEYLTSNKLAFEEKNLETNREFLAEMLKLSNNFAGVPFTLVEKDNAQVVSIKGFTKEEFDVVFGFAAPAVDPVVPTTPEAPVVTPEPVAPVMPEVKPVVPEVPSASSGQVQPVTIPEIKPMEPVAPVSPAPTVEPVVSETPVVPTTPEAPVVTPEPVAPVAPVTPTPVADPNEELKKVIDSLGAMTNEQKPADTKPVVPPGTPSIPDFPTNK